MPAAAGPSVAAPDSKDSIPETAPTRARAEPANHLIQGRRGDAELLGRSTEVERLRDCDEGAELAEIAGGEKGIVGAHWVIA